MKKVIFFIFLILIGAGVGWSVFVKNGNGQEKSTYEFVEIERGTIENVISGTGTLEAVGTVEVGTQVSGKIDRILVDFNDTVRKGQILAILDTTFLAASVREAEAKVLQTQAQYDQAVIDYERNQELFEENFITKSQLETSETQVRTTKASLLSAEASLERNKTNLGYAVIESPINGTVIHRNVEPGQTVAASLSAPVLFLIAQDLSKMEIYGLVDESDIGQIKVGQEVRFTVEAYFDKEFYGTVQQIRLQPETISNVVTYTVIIDANNEEGLLYPGMTATVDFIAEKVENVLTIANKALRFQPTTAMMQQFRKTMQKKREEHLASLPQEEQDRIRERMANRPAPPAGGMMQNETDRDIARLWAIDENENLMMIPVRKGVTDGTKTEIIPLSEQRRRMPAPEPKEEMQIISAVNSNDTKVSEKSNKPLFQMMGRPGGGRGR